MKYLLLASVLISPFALANENVNYLLDEIKYLVNNESQDRRTIKRVEKQLERTLSLLTGGATPTPTPTPGPSNSELICLSKDDDGMAPYVLGVKDGSTLQTTKIADSYVGSLVSCQETIKNAVLAKDIVLACLSKDNDNLSPFSLTIISNNGYSKKLSTVGSMENCNKAAKNAFIAPRALSVCISKDNDGMSPYVKAIVSFGDFTVTNQEQYSSLETCMNSNN